MRVREEEEHLSELRDRNNTVTVTQARTKQSVGSFIQLYLAMQHNKRWANLAPIICCLILRWELQSGISLLDFFFFLFFPQSSPCLRPWQVYKCRLCSYLSGWYIKNTSSHFLLVKINNIRYRQRVVGIITGDGYSLKGSFSADRRWKNLQRTELFLGYKTHQQEGGNKEIESFRIHCSDTWNTACMWEGLWLNFHF